MLKSVASVGTVLRWLARVGLATVIILLGGGYAQGYRLLAVQSNSMQPVFGRGDALVIRRVTADNLNPGVIVSYRSPINEQVTISHRLLAVNAAKSTLTTQGDALTAPDPPVPFQNVIGRDKAVIPRLGSVVDFVRQPFGVLIAVYLPAGLLAARAVWQFSRQTYRLVYRVNRQT